MVLKTIMNEKEPEKEASLGTSILSGENANSGAERIAEIGARTRSSLVWQIALPLLWEGGRFAVSIAIARILDPRDFGIISLAAIIVVYANSLSEIGFSNSIIRHKEIDHTHTDSVFTLNMCISIALMVFTISMAGKAAEISGQYEIKYVLIGLSPLFIITSFSQIPAALLRRNLDYKNYSIAGFLQAAMQSLISLWMALTGFGYWSLVGGFVGGELAFAVWVIWKTGWRPRVSIKTKSLKSLLDFSCWSFVMSQVVAFNDYMDKAIIGKYLGPSLLGAYSKAYALAMMPIGAITLRLNNVMFSSFSRQREDRREIDNLTSKVLMVSTILCFPILFWLSAVATLLIPLMYGPKWQAAIAPLEIICYALCLKSVNGLLWNLNLSIGKYRLEIASKTLGVVLMVGSCLVVVDEGLAAISWVIVVQSLYSLGTSMFLAKRFVNIGYGQVLRAILPALIASLGISLSVHILAGLVKTVPSLSDLLMQTVASIIAYLMLLIIPDYENTRWLKRTALNQLQKIIRGQFRFSS